jgi:hypothetical protein
MLDQMIGLEEEKDSKFRAEMASKKCSQSIGESHMLFCLKQLKVLMRQEMDEYYHEAYRRACESVDGPTNGQMIRDLLMDLLDEVILPNAFTEIDQNDAKKARVNIIMEIYGRTTDLGVIAPTEWKTENIQPLDISDSKQMLGLEYEESDEGLSIYEDSVESRDGLNDAHSESATDSDDDKIDVNDKKSLSASESSGSVLVVRLNSSNNMSGSNSQTKHSSAVAPILDPAVVSASASAVVPTSVSAVVPTSVSAVVPTSASVASAVLPASASAVVPTSATAVASRAAVVMSLNGSNSAGPKAQDPGVK